MFETVKADLAAAAAAFEGWIGHLPPEVQGAAANVVGDIRAVGETAIDAEVATIVGPAFAPEVIAILNGAIDGEIAKIEAQLASRTAGLTAAKAAISALPVVPA